jgi:hypothetical protein
VENIQKLKNLKNSIRNFYEKNGLLPQEIINITQTNDLEKSLSILENKIKTDNLILNIFSGLYEQLFSTNLSSNQNTTKFIHSDNNKFYRIDEIQTNNLDDSIFYNITINVSFTNFSINDIDYLSLGISFDGKNFYSKLFFNSPQNLLNISAGPKENRLQSIVCVIKENISSLPIIFLNNNRSFTYFSNEVPLFSYNGNIKNNYSQVQLDQNNQPLNILMGVLVNTNKNTNILLSSDLKKTSSSDLENRISISVYKVFKSFSNRIRVNSAII